MDSFSSKASLQIDNQTYTIYRLDALEKAGLVKIDQLPFSIRILLENLLRSEDGKSVSRTDIENLAKWNPKEKPSKEIAFTPARVILQDFTGVPAVVDLAAMRESIKKMGGDPKKVNPLEAVDLVIDHSVQVDSYGTPQAFQENTDKEFSRNNERYQFLRWGQQAFQNFRVVPPGTGIVHQVNLEYLAHVVFRKKTADGTLAYPDTLVGTDSHTTMINGLGVLGWGVGGIEAEAAMLGQPISMLIPQVIGFKLKGTLPEGSTATDLVLTATQMLRQKGVVGKFVEFYGPGLDTLPLADRATLANMAPEYGATMGFVPVDQETLNYLRLTARDPELVKLVEIYTQEQRLLRTPSSPDPVFSDTLELDLSTVQPSLAGPKRPQDRVVLNSVKNSFAQTLSEMLSGDFETKKNQKASVQLNNQQFELGHGDVVIAAITSCTNTSNPAVMIGAGLVAKKAVEKGLTVKPWVKTSLAPGSQVVTEYLKQSGVMPYLEKLNFHLVGYGCTTCIGNSGPLPEPVSTGIKEKNLVAVSVLSGNRNFEGRVNPHVKANYLASPLLVVAYALAGRIDIDLTAEALGQDAQGNAVYLRDIWPSQKEIAESMKSIQAGMFQSKYEGVFKGNADWQSIKAPSGDTFVWDDKSTYVKNPPYFENMPETPAPLKDIKNARVLAMLGDSVTTDHISPAGSIPKDSPAGRYLIENGVDSKDFNSYGARRGNHEVMVRGTFGNIRLRNQLAPGTEGGMTRHLPDGQQMSIYDAAMKYHDEATALIVLAGKEYGTGSSRDWAAKGPALQGIRAVIAESFERIHRSNLIGMGILPLQYQEGQTRESLGLSGEEVYTLTGIEDGLMPGKKITCQADEKKFEVICRIDTPVELAYYQHGGILQYVLRQLLKSGNKR
ncbi:MAG: aconitate hydratase AcnA [Candidatus Omnitrophica bacterium]|nr:aconitate hydratase AcnA [Candidatus Omnitrophota bacterium]